MTRFLRNITLLLTLGFLFIGTSEIHESTTNSGPSENSGKINGVAFTAPPSEIAASEFDPIAESNSGWIQIIPYAFCRPGETFVKYGYPQQWWGESPEGVRKQIDFAREKNLKVLLKPHLWVLGQGWAGDFDFDEDEKWAKWEKEYEDYIIGYARIAEEKNVEMLCLGTEIRHSVRERTLFWKKLIKKVKAVYDRKLIYASNWDNYQKVKFWKDLDYIGIDAYFPLSDKKTPTVQELCEKWKIVVPGIKGLSNSTGKEVVFTEYGYMSVDKAAWRNWELESGKDGLNPNPKAQANAYEALFQTFWSEYIRPILLMGQSFTTFQR